MTLEDLSFYQALEEIDPSGAERDDWRAAIGAFMTYGVIRALGGKRVPKRKAEDFLVVRRKRRRESGAQSLLALRAMVDSVAGRKRPSNDDAQQSGR